MGAFTSAIGAKPIFANDNETVATFLLDVRGQAAALAGAALASNPYGANSFEAACWSAGWLKGAREIFGVQGSAQPARARLRAVTREPDSTPFGCTH